MEQVRASAHRRRGRPVPPASVVAATPRPAAWRAARPALVRHRHGRGDGPSADRPARRRQAFRRRGRYKTRVLRGGDPALPKITRNAILTVAGPGPTSGWRQGSAGRDHDLRFCTQIGTFLSPSDEPRLRQDPPPRRPLPGVRLHDLRHTVVSLLLALGNTAARGLRQSPGTRHR
ncbi:hypothetical protein HBB16_04065 [Pseudonocardia sp. MCCB 268]|nr:hypothetical protein [Pseudonocardia cytotoxica]